jgi:predicted phage terminase large subunit-like protein
MSFYEFCVATTPELNWDARHVEYLREVLDKVTAGEIDKVMVFMPFQHGKSEQATIHYAAYRIYRKPSERVILATNTQKLADKFSRRIRKLVSIYVPLADDQQALTDWATQSGGGLRAVGWGASVVGNPGDILFMDDPIVGREEAESKLNRDRVWDSYLQELKSRIPENGPQVLIMTRWHEDDIAGRLLASEYGKDWTVVRLPAVAEENDPIGRAVGEALFPERYSTAYFDEQRTLMGERMFASVYQQDPKPREGMLFKVQFMEIVDAAPAGGKYMRYWDKAGTAGGNGAETAGVKVQLANDGTVYIHDVEHGRWSALEREQVIKNTATMDGTACHVCVEQEPGSGGKESAESTVRGLAGYVVHVDRVSGEGSKVLRAEPFAAQVEAGNVKMVRGEWNAVFRDQLAAFPDGRLKDMVDAASGAFTKLAEMRGKSGGFKAWGDSAATVAVGTRNV